MGGDSKFLDRIEEDGHQLYTARRGDEVLGFVAIDSTIDGRARGGLRMLPDVTAAEIRDAARAMTLKYGFLGLPQGGAKAGVRGDPFALKVEKHARLIEFAQIIRPLLETRLYVPDSDMGTQAEDIRAMMRSVGSEVGRQEWRTHRSGFYTALSCLASAEATLQHLGTSIAGSSVAIEGFGSVGSNLATLLAERGAQVVAVSTVKGAVHDPAGLEIDRLVRMAEEHGDGFVHEVAPHQRLERSAVLELEVDLLCPCARRHGIDRHNVDRIAAPVICPGANDPVSPAAEERLFQSGRTLVPDFVSNSGGVLGGTLEFAGVGESRIQAMFREFLTQRVEGILEQASDRNCSMRSVAEPEALERHARVRRAAEDPSHAGRLIGLGLDAYRRGWIPKWLVGRFAPFYIRGLLEA